MKKFGREDLLFGIILLLAVLARFYNFADWSLSNDELSAMARLHFTSFSEMIEKGVKLNDMHPMGVQSFLWYWTKAFGESVAAFRLPFVVMGCFSVFFFYKIAASWFNKSAALYSTLFFSFLQFPILYSQLARPYSPGLLFSLMTVFFWNKIVFPSTAKKSSGTEWYWYVLFVLCVTATMYVHYFAFLFSALVAITGLFYIPKKELKWYLLSGVAMFVLYVPNYPVFFYQFSIGGLGGPDGWLGAPKSNALLTYIGYSLNDSTIVWILSLGILLLTLFVNYKKTGFTRYHLFALMFSMLPALIAYFYSIFKNPVFQYSILIFGFPFLLMFICSYIPTIHWNLKQVLLLTGTGALLFYSTAAEKKFYSTQHFGVFKELAVRTVYYDSLYGANNIVNTVNVITPFYIDYYLKQYSKTVNYGMYACVAPADFAKLDHLADSTVQSKTFFLHAWSNTYHAPEVEQIIRTYYPYIAANEKYFNSGITVYSKLPQKNDLEYRTLVEKYDYGFESNKWLNDSANSSIENPLEGKFASRIDSGIEYGATYSSTIWKNCTDNTMEVKLWVKSNKLPEKCSLVCSIDRAGKNIFWRNAAFHDYITVCNRWMPVYLAFKIPQEVQPGDAIKIFVWNPGKESATFDSFSYKIWK